MSIEKALTDEERLAGLDLNQLKTLVGLVEYDGARDPFPLLGWDAVVLGRRQHDPVGALLPIGLRHGTHCLFGTHHRQP